ncbi:gluconolactonase [Devosia crocina]|uniref:Gluconolactonase n=1 Tax=Devosia crocina TaxID=429728 RepID=A0A1I7NE12_9HYPH|nr:SMP-30/gluconolactonase/LRE family protein [Devosia crocina]SFV32786.1 gluconolactonase [Devosia crocina]
MAASVHEIIDQRFRDLIIGSAQLERLYGQCRWAEGPVWFKDGDYLLWSDIPNRRMMRYQPDGTVSVFRSDSHFSNGNTRDRLGRLVTCEHGTRRVTRTEVDGTITVLANSFEGKRLNSPNDVIVHSSGSIWFTDPTYGILSDYEGFKAVPEQPARNVFRLDPATGELNAVVSDFLQPNGLVFSPDEKLLYVVDSGASHKTDAPKHIRVFDVVGGKTLTNNRVFCEVPEGIPDGLRVDVHGNVWTSGGPAIHCFAPDGTLLGRIHVPERVANLTFGGIKANRLFIAATTSIYSIYLATNGAQTP